MFLFFHGILCDTPKKSRVKKFDQSTTLSTLRAVGFSYAKRERNHCEHPSAFPSSMRNFVMPHVMILMSISFVSNFLLEVLVQKNANLSPKALTKEQSKPLSKYCLYLVCGLNGRLQKISMPIPRKAFSISEGEGVL